MFYQGRYPGPVKDKEETTSPTRYVTFEFAPPKRFDGPDYMDGSAYIELPLRFKADDFSNGMHDN